MSATQTDARPIVTAPHGLRFRLRSVTFQLNGDVVVAGHRVDAIDTEFVQVPAGTEVSFLFDAATAARLLAEV